MLGYAILQKLGRLRELFDPIDTTPQVAELNRERQINIAETDNANYAKLLFLTSQDSFPPTLQTLAGSIIPKSSPSSVGDAILSSYVRSLDEIDLAAVIAPSRGLLLTAV